MVLLSAPFASFAEVVVIVKSDSSVSSIEKSDLTRIFLGRAKAFPNGDKAVPVNQAAESAVRTEFDDVLLGKSQSQMKAYWAKQSFSGRGTAPEELSGDAAIVSMVSGDATAIGYVDASAVNGSVKVIYTVQ